MLSSKTSLENSFTRSIHHLFKKKKWDQVVESINQKLNEPKISWDDPSVTYLYLTTAYAYFLKEDFTRSKHYLKFFLLKEFPNNGAGTLFLAYFHLLENDKPAAITLYTQLLKNPLYFKRAQKILNFLKKSNHNNFADYRTSFFYKHHFFLDHAWSNYLPFNLKFRAVWFFLSIIFLLFFYWNKKNSLLIFENFLPNIFSNQEEKNRSELKENLPPPFNTFYNDMEKAIKERKINNAIIIYNQALNHNPTLPIEEKFSILKSFIPTPNFSNLNFIKDLNPYQANPTFYQGIYLKFIAEYKFSNNNFDFFNLGQIKGYSLIIPTDDNYSLGQKKKYQILIRLNKINAKKQILGEKVNINLINTEKPLLK